MADACANCGKPLADADQVCGLADQWFCSWSCRHAYALSLRPVQPIVSKENL